MRVIKSIPLSIPSGAGVGTPFGLKGTQHEVPVYSVTLPASLRLHIPETQSYAPKKPRRKVGIKTGFGGGSPLTAELAK